MLKLKDLNDVDWTKAVKTQEKRVVKLPDGSYVEVPVEVITIPMKEKQV